MGTGIRRPFNSLPDSHRKATVTLERVTVDFQFPTGFSLRLYINLKVKDSNAFNSLPDSHIIITMLFWQ